MEDKVYKNLTLTALLSYTMAVVWLTTLSLSFLNTRVLLYQKVAINFPIDRQ